MVITVKKQNYFMEKNQDTDISVPFILPHFSVRGRLIRLEKVSSSILKQHKYPPAVGKVLAELLATSAALAGLLKYEGIFTLQTKSNGPIELLVIDITDTGNIRGFSQFNEYAIHQDSTFSELFGDGYLAYTVDQGLNVDRYQGIVKLHNESLSSAIEHYFDQSEQLKTKIVVASQKTKDGKWRSSALLLQQLPAQEVNEESWNHIDALLSTLSLEEFLDFSAPHETLLYRLFHEGGVLTYEGAPLKAKCRCSRERIKAFLSSLTQEEVEELLENGQLKMTCEFCNHSYNFDRKELITIH